MIGFIDLEHCSLVDNPPTPPAGIPTSHIFDLHDAEIPRHYYLVADSAQVKSEWIRELRRVLIEARLQRLRRAGAPLPPLPPIGRREAITTPSLVNVEEDKDVHPTKPASISLATARTPTPKGSRRKVSTSFMYIVV